MLGKNPSPKGDQKENIYVTLYESSGGSLPWIANSRRV